MHIGYDISQIGNNKAGCGFFAHTLIKSMLELAPQHRYSLYPSFGDFYFDSRMPIFNPYEKGEYGPRHLTRETAAAFWTKPDIESALGSPDIIHANNFWCPTQIEKSRLIYTFYDMGFIVNPSWTTETNRTGCFEGVFRASIMADWIVAISKASRDHFLAIFPHFPKERIQVIYPCSRYGNDISEMRPKALANVLSGNFWLSVGTIEPRKNQLSLAKAYKRYLELKGKPIPLVFAGGKGWLMEDFQEQLQILGIKDQVIFTGYITDEELVWLYKNCYANLYPSLFEGFGLPILEGMQFGAATLASNSSSLPEVAGDAALLLPPEDIEAWAQAMLELISNPNKRESLCVISKIQAKKFNLDRGVKSLTEIYKNALASPKLYEVRKIKYANLLV